MNVPEANIHESIDSFIQFIHNLKLTINIFRTEFKKVYDNYIIELGKLSASERKKFYGSHRKIQKIYDKVNKLLNNYVNNFAGDYSDTLSLAIDISSLKEEFTSYVTRYPESRIEDLGPNELYQLTRKLSSITERHNKLAILYNARIHRFNALKENIKNYTLVYETSDHKSMTVSISDQLYEFERLISDSFITKRFLGTNVVSNFLKSLGNSANSAILTSIKPLNPENWRVNSADRFPPPDLGEDPNYEENSEFINKQEELFEAEKLITKTKLLTEFDNITAEDKIKIKDTAIKIYLDSQLLSLDEDSDFWRTFHQMLEDHPYLMPNCKLNNGVIGLIEETLRLEDKLLMYLKTSPKDLFPEAGKEDTIQDLFEFEPKSEAAFEIFSYYRNKEFISQLQVYFMIYLRNKWIEQMFNNDMSDEFLREHMGYYKRVHGFAEAINMEDTIMKDVIKTMITQIREFDNDDIDMSMEYTYNELKDQLRRYFLEINWKYYMLFVDKLQKAKYKVKTEKGDEINDSIERLEKELEGVKHDYEEILQRYNAQDSDEEDEED